MSTGLWIIEPTNRSWSVLHAICEHESQYNVWEQELFNRLAKAPLRVHYFSPLTEAANVMFIEYAAAAFANDTAAHPRPSGDLPFVLHLGYERQKLATYQRLGVYLPPTPEQIQSFDNVQARARAPRPTPSAHIYIDTPK